MGRAPCGSGSGSGEDKELGLKKGAWTAEEDEKLVSFIQRNNGHGSWRTLPKLAGLERCGKSCRLRWTNYLRPNIKRGNFSVEEERIIIQLHAFMGNKWSSIASHLPGRTDNEVKNHWNTHLKKKLTKMGIDPTTHLPLQFILPQNQDAANYYNSLLSQSSFHSTDDWKMALLQMSLQLDPTIACHLAQLELARMEAETRMQIAVSSHASWLQSLQQQSQAPANNLNDLIMHAMSQQLRQQATLNASNSPLVNTWEHIQPSQYCDHQLLRQAQLTSWGNEEKEGLASSSTTSGGSVPQASEGPVYTSACSSESTSELLLCDELQLPELVNDQMMPLPALSPPSPTLPHDSYWNKMLNLLTVDV